MMKPILYVLCLGVLIGGVTHGTPRMKQDTSTAAAATLLFWGSLFGLLCLLLSPLALIGVVLSCDESNPTESIYDVLFTGGQQLGWICGAFALLGHGLLFYLKRSKP